MRTLVIMGTSKPKAAPTPVIQDNTAQLQQEYSNSLAAIQKQSADTQTQLQQSNQQAQQAIQQQLQQSQQAQADYQKQLQQYLQTLNQQQDSYNQALSQRDAASKALQDQQTNTIDASNIQSNLATATSLAGSQFQANTRRGLLG